MNRPYFWAIQDVTANRTAQKNIISTKTSKSAVQNLWINMMNSEISYLLAMQKH